MRTRRLPEDNYAAMFLEDGGKTYRFTLTDGPMKELSFPEFYDVAINNWCAGGCGYCYVAAKKSGTHFNDVVGKINRIFGSMSLNQRPFQVALGGEGEPTSHPDFVRVLEAFRNLSIVPNYTTNGMHLDDKILEATQSLSGGVAVSIHPHLRDSWTRAIRTYADAGVRLNLHFVVSNAKSIDLMWEAFNEYKSVVDYFVVLPYMSNREAPTKHVDTTHLEWTLDQHEDLSQIAFGSNLYPFLKPRSYKYSVSLYEPESMSKYLILNDPIGLYSDSHGMKPITQGPLRDVVNAAALD